MVQTLRPLRFRTVRTFGQIGPLRFRTRYAFRHSDGSDIQTASLSDGSDIRTLGHSDGSEGSDTRTFGRFG